MRTKLQENSLEVSFFFGMLLSVGERNAKRNTDLRRGAELDARRAIRLVEVPELAHLLLEAVGGEHPILVLDHLPDFERQAREGDGRGVPVLVRLLLPLGPDLVMPFADRDLALSDARLELCVAGDALPAMVYRYL